jgi:hypothetical protein
MEPNTLLLAEGNMDIAYFIVLVVLFIAIGFAIYNRDKL